MAKNKSKKRKTAFAVVRDSFRRLSFIVGALSIGGALLVGGLFYFVFSLVQEQPPDNWRTGLGLAVGAILLIGIAALGFISAISRRTQEKAKNALTDELGALQQNNHRAQALQEMTDTLSATLNFERVLDVALDVSGIALDELNVPTNKFIGGVFLFEGESHLKLVASRHLGSRNVVNSLRADAGIIAKSLQGTDPVFTHTPTQDSELNKIAGFQKCKTVISIPLRAGFQLFGAMILGTGYKVKFEQEQLDHFTAVANRAVIALQNAQLYQDLETEKRRMVEADEEARKELARNLHDGPTQSIAAIAMQLNFIRSLMLKEPRKAAEELAKVEELAKSTSKDIRSMLFALRPLVLETDGLGAAIETLMAKLRETDRLNIRLIGGENGDLLTEQAQSVVFSIVDEAIGNARKYSKANLIEVRLWKEAGLFVARVQDDGVGFNVPSVMKNYSSRGSLGMVNMRERAERIDGSIKLDSAPGKGTAVTLVVPLDRHGVKVGLNGFGQR